MIFIMMKCYGLSDKSKAERSHISLPLIVLIDAVILSVILDL